MIRIYSCRLQFRSTSVISRQVYAHRLPKRPSPMARMYSSSSSLLNNNDTVYLHVGPSGDCWTGPSLFAAKHLQPDYVKSIPLMDPNVCPETLVELLEENTILVQKIYDAGVLPPEIIIVASASDDSSSDATNETWINWTYYSIYVTSEWKWERSKNEQRNGEWIHEIVLQYLLMERMRRDCWLCWESAMVHIEYSSIVVWWPTTVEYRRLYPSTMECIQVPCSSWPSASRPRSLMTMVLVPSSFLDMILHHDMQCKHYGTSKTHLERNMLDFIDSYEMDSCSILWSRDWPRV